MQRIQNRSNNNNTHNTMGEVEKEWEEKKQLRRVEALKVLREFQREEIKAQFVKDAKQVIFNAEMKLRRTDLTEEEINECDHLIENAQNIINKHNK